MQWGRNRGGLSPPKFHFIPTPMLKLHVTCVHVLQSIIYLHVHVRSYGIKLLIKSSICIMYMYMYFCLQMIATLKLDSSNA